MLTVLPAPSVVLTVGWSYAVTFAPAPAARPIVPSVTSADDGIVNPVGRSAAVPASLLLRRARKVALRPVIAPEPTVNAPTCGRRVVIDVVVPAAIVPAPTPPPCASAARRPIAVKFRSPLAPVCTLAPVPIQAFALAVFVAVVVVELPLPSRPTLRKLAVADGADSAVAVAPTPPLPVVVTVVGEPLPASVPMYAPTAVVSLAATVAPPMLATRLTPVNALLARGV